MNDELLSTHPQLRWCIVALGVMDEALEDAGLSRDRALPLTVLTPPDGFWRFSVEVYRAHVVELISRFKRTRKLAALDVMTDAEIMIGLYHASLAAPLAEGPSALYARIFERTFGRLPWSGDPWREAWPGQLDEIAHKARRSIIRPRPEQPRNQPLPEEVAPA